MSETSSFEQIQKENLAGEVRIAVRLLKQLMADMDLLTRNQRTAYPLHVAEYLSRIQDLLQKALRDAGEAQEVEA